MVRWDETPNDSSPYKQSSGSGEGRSRNLTPDQDTGIVAWREQMFVGAMKTGKHMGVSRPILPPMPWPAYRNLTADDLKAPQAMFACLRTVPPIKNRVPDPVFASH